MKNMQAGFQNLVHRASAIDAREMAQEKLNANLLAHLLKSTGACGVAAFGFGEGGPEDGDTAEILGHTFQFTEYGDVTEGNIPVLIGEDNDATLEAFIDAINGCGFPDLKYTAAFNEDDHVALLYTTAGPGSTTFDPRAISASDFDHSGDGDFTIMGYGADPADLYNFVYTRELTAGDLSGGISLLVPFSPVSFQMTVARDGDVFPAVGVTVEIEEGNPLIRISFSDGEELNVAPDDVLHLLVFGGVLTAPEE